MKILLTDLYYKVTPPLLPLSLIMGLIGFSILYFTNTIHTPLYLLTVLSCTVAMVIFCIVDRRSKSHNPEETTHDDLRILSQRTVKLLDILYVSLIVSALLLLQQYETRPTAYFAIIAVLAGIVAFSILFSSDSVLKHMVKIFVLSFLSIFSLFKVYVWGGYDTWTHAAFNELIVRTGEILPQLGKEASYPIQHLLVPIMDIFAGTDIIESTFLSCTIPLIIVSVLVLYIVVNKFCNQKCALLSLLLYVFMPMVISWASIPQTTTMGFLVFCLLFLVYILILPSSDGVINKRYLFLLILLEIIMVITHTFTSFIVLLIIAAIYIGSIIRDNKLITFELFFAISYFLILIICWLCGTWGDNTSIFYGVLSIADSSLNFAERAVVPEHANYINILPPSQIELTLNSLFFIVLITAIFLFFLITTKRKNGFSNKMWVMISITLFTTGCYGVSMLVLAEMSHRFELFFVLCGVFAIGVSMLYFVRKIEAVSIRTISKMLFVIFVVFFVFISVGSSSINSDNQLFLRDTTPSLGPTVTENLGLETLVHYLPDLQVNTYDHMLSPVYGYHAYLQAYDTMHTIPSFDYHRSIYIDWYQLSESGKENLLFRYGLLDKPTLISIKYGSEFGERYSITIQLEQSYVDMLNYNYSLVYTNDALGLYPLKH